MTAGELAEADRRRRKANVESATRSRRRRRELVEQLREQAGDLQAANIALIRENQTLEHYIKHYTEAIEKESKKGSTNINRGVGMGSPVTMLTMNNGPMSNNGSPALLVMPPTNTCMSTMQAPMQAQGQTPAQYQGGYNAMPLLSTQSFPWQNQQQIQQQMMPTGQSMAGHPSFGQERILWAQQRQDQQTQQPQPQQLQQIQTNPPDIYMQMAAILLNQAQQQQAQQQQNYQQQQYQYNPAVTTSPTPSPWSQLPNGAAPVVNSTNLAQVDANALIAQIMNYGGTVSGWNNGQQIPQAAATTMTQAQPPHAQVSSSSQPFGYQQPSAVETTFGPDIPTQQQPNMEQRQSEMPSVGAQSLSLFSIGDVLQNNESGTNDTSLQQRQQQQDDPSFWLAQLQSLGLPDEININMQDGTNDEALDDDLFDKLDDGSLGQNEEDEN